MPITIAVDAMGGDHGPSIVVPACFKALSKRPLMRLIIVGDEHIIDDAIRALPKKYRKRRFEGHFQIQHCSQVVSINDEPAVALRQKKDSSMRVAANLVKQGDAMACVSAGNTGAFMAITRFVFKTPRDIRRPAIISTLPTLDGHVHMLDLGANVDCTADHFLQFSIMGTILSRHIDGIDRPRVGLLNIGEEKIKGNEQVKRAAERISQFQDEINYIGYIEADGIFEGAADVVVCDGFVGNVALKTMEGMVKLVRGAIKTELTSKPSKLAFSALSFPLWLGLKKRLNTGSYNGASMIGLNYVAIKSHGNADVNSFLAAILRAEEEVNNDIPALIRSGMADLRR